MSAATIVFMIATYWVGGSAPTEGGKYLANGQVYDNKQFVAAHRTLPFGTLLHVCLRRQCVSVVVKDRGPGCRTADRSVIRRSESSRYAS